MSLCQHISWRRHSVEMTENDSSAHTVSVWNMGPMLVERQQEEPLDGKQFL